MEKYPYVLTLKAMIPSKKHMQTFQTDPDSLRILYTDHLFLNDILHMSFLAGIHVFKAFPAYTTTEI